MKHLLPLFLYTQVDDAGSGAAAAAAAAAVETPAGDIADEAAVAAAAAAQVAADAANVQPVTVDGLNEEQIRAKLGELTTVTGERDALQTQLDTITGERNTITGERDTSRTELETERTAGNNLRLQLALIESATELGYNIHPETLRERIQLGDFADVVFNDEREPQGVTEALKTLVTSKPRLLQKADAPKLDGENAGRDTPLASPAAQRAGRNLVSGF